MISEEAALEGTTARPLWQVAHNGGINVNANGNVEFNYGADVIPVPADPISSIELRVAEELYVYPKAHDETLVQLHKHLLIVQGPSGIGKRTTAIHLLCGLAQKLRTHAAPCELKLREVRADWDKPNALRLPYKQQHGYLLDLGPETRPFSAEFASGLLAHHERLKTAKSFMVITATPSMLEICQQKLHDHLVSIDEPAPALDIATKRLDLNFNMPERSEWLKKKEVADYLPSGTKPADAVRMAEALGHAPGDETEGVKRAVDEFRGWKEALLTWFQANKTAFTRAALITAALIEPAPSKKEISLRAQDLVTEVEGEQPAELNALRAADLSSRLCDIELTEVDGGVSLTQARSGFDEAVLDHMWEERPELRQPFQKWVLGMTAAEKPGSSIVKRIAHALTGMSIRSGSAVFLDYVKQWVDADSQQNNIYLAQAMLEETAVHPVVGPLVRRRLLAWAKGVNPELAVVTARVCGSELGERMTGVAATRLRHILRHNDEAAREAAKESLIKLAHLDSHRLLMLGIVVGWMQVEETAHAGAMAFLTLTTEGSLAETVLHDAAGDDAMRSILMEGWRQFARSDMDQSRIVDAMTLWLITADRKGMNPQHALNILDTALKESIIDSLALEFFKSVHGRVGSDSDLPAMALRQTRECFDPNHTAKTVTEDLQEQGTV